MYTCADMYIYIYIYIFMISIPYSCYFIAHLPCHQTHLPFDVGVARDLKRVVERKGDQKITDTPNGVDARLEKLRAFQIAALKKAMSFPAVKHVVYSTCSIHEEENESVVTEVLLNNTENILNSEGGIHSSEEHQAGTIQLLKIFDD
jgi:hypothetical protein